MIEVKMVNVTADVANMFLAKEKTPEPGVKGTNRKASDKVIAQYASAMLRGEWVLTPHGIAFNDQEVTIDGGHRMRAVALAAETKPDISIPFMVAYGVEDDAVIAMDIGKRRLPSDFLTMNGEVNVMNLTGVIRASYCYENVPWNGPQSWLDHRITPAMQQDYLDANPQTREAVLQGFTLKRVLKGSVAGAFWLQARKLWADKTVRDFLDPLRTGANLEKGNPILTLRELMFTSKEIRRVYTVPEELALTIKAFNRWVEDGTYEVLMFRWDEKFPRIKTKDSV